ncbi:MAG TPA: sugar ABC transporter permease, partial [Spirochaeta sp.]|nr:sugar ABC transporter permease [Spirochaeta sp.]
SVPQDLLEASIIDGAGWFTRLKSVIFPFMVPVISMNLVLTVRNGVMVFDVIKVMTGGGPGYTTSSVGITIYNMGFYEMKFGFSTAISLFLFLIIAVISFAQISLLRKKGTGQL